MNRFTTALTAAALVALLAGCAATPGPGHPPVADPPVQVEPDPEPTYVEPETELPYLAAKIGLLYDPRFDGVSTGIISAEAQGVLGEVELAALASVDWSTLDDSQLDNLELGFRFLALTMEGRPVASDWQPRLLEWIAGLPGTVNTAPPAEF